jgi:uncharacterized protein (TIGR03085 family)
MASDLDLRERHELSDLLDRLGPDQPTLCEGWTTADLAAHLVVRERDPRSGPGILLGGRFEEYTDKLMARQLERYGYTATVERVRTGPPWGPMRIPPLRHAMNLVEYFTHHEDVRRPSGLGPRTDRPDLDDELWSYVRRMGPMMVRRAKLDGVRLTLQRPDGASVDAGKGDQVVTMAGAPGELVLALYGRDGAEVTYEGQEQAVTTVRAGSFGF